MARKNLEETGMSYQLEVDMIRKARQLGLLTTPYVFNAEEAKLMAAVRSFNARSNFIAGRHC
jgi:predicted TIM-barrel enzyme